MRKVKIVPYNAEWKNRFKEIKQNLLNILANKELEIHHIGSTSIKNMGAKDTIDVLMVVKNLDIIDQYDEEMKANGYIGFGENYIHGRRYFEKVDSNNNTHLAHIHIYERGHVKIQEELKFRDYLRMNPDAFQKYLNIKREGANKFENYPDKYQAYKANIIEKLLKEANIFFEQSLLSQQDCGFSKEQVFFRYRAAGIIVTDSHVLLASNTHNDYYYSVGGGVQVGETSDQAVIRELYEETGIRFEIDRLAIIHENIYWGEDDDFNNGKICHEICFYYKMKSPGLINIDHISETSGGYEEFVSWVNVKDLDRVVAYPLFLKDYILSGESELKHIITNRIDDK